MKDEKDNPSNEDEKEFTYGVDYIMEEGLMILTKRFLLKRGFCCTNGCLNCPYPTATPKD